MWLLPVHVPIAADTSVALPQLVELVRNRLGADTQKTKSRRAKVEAIYAEARKKSQAWIEKAWDEKPISQARFFSEINKTNAEKVVGVGIVAWPALARSDRGY